MLHRRPRFVIPVFCSVYQIVNRIATDTLPHKDIHDIDKPDQFLFFARLVSWQDGKGALARDDGVRGNTCPPMFCIRSFGDRSIPRQADMIDSYFERRLFFLEEDLHGRDGKALPGTALAIVSHGCQGLGGDHQPKRHIEPAEGHRVLRLGHPRRVRGVKKI